MRDFGEILAENRKKKGYSQSDLVDLLSQEGIQVTTKAIHISFCISINKICPGIPGFSFLCIFLT